MYLEIEMYEAVTLINPLYGGSPGHAHSTLQ